MDPNLMALVHRLTEGLRLDEVDGEVFAIRLEREWRTRRRLAWDLFGGVGHLMEEEIAAQREDLQAMLDWFAEREMWEYCGPCRDMLTRLWERP